MAPTDHRPTTTTYGATDEVGLSEGMVQSELIGMDHRMSASMVSSEWVESVVFLMVVLCSIRSHSWWLWSVLLT